MYDNFKLLNYSNSLVSPELYARHLSRLFTGNVVDGLLVIPKTGLTVTLPTGNGFIPYGSGATASNREFSLVADFDITLDTADASNPRIDLIVVYVDMGVSLPGGTPTSANLDGPGVVKATFVKGAPNASPVVPTVGAIQTKIGAANPYIIVSEVRVDATVTTIAGNKITDRRVMVGPSASFVASTPAASIGGAALASYRVTRQNNTTNSTETTASILTGWGYITPGAASSAIEAVTFSTAFTSPPIVIICGGGDHTSSTTYGLGSISIKRMYADAVAITVSGFNAYVASTDGTNWAAGNTVFYQWIAIGV